MVVCSTDHTSIWLVAPPCLYFVVCSAGIEKKWHHRWCNVVPPVAPRGTTWHHCCTTVVPRGTTEDTIITPLMQNFLFVVPQWHHQWHYGGATWHHRSATVVPSGATWCHVVPRGATGGTTLRHRWCHFFYACRPYNRVRTGWCNQILVWSVEQTRG